MSPAHLKAVEITNAFEGALTSSVPHYDEENSIEAKKCAKACVDQIMIALDWDSIPTEYKDNFWPDVKKEIDKL
jgi:hypothetical protein